MTDTPVTANGTSEAPAQPLNLFITGADMGAGLLVTRAATRAGHRVTGATTNGSAGAVRIREAGGIPVYPDLTREGELRSILMMAKADMIVNLWPQALNGLPHLRTDYSAHRDTLREGAHALVSIAGKMGIKRVIHLSFGYLYGDHGDTPITEDTPVLNSTPLYDAAAEAEAFVLDGGIPGYVLRTGTLYAAGLPALADHLRGGGLIPAGTGHTSWLHEADLASAIMRLISHTSEAESSATVFNLADAAPATFDQFADLLGQTLGVASPTRYPNVLLTLRTNPQQRQLLAQNAVLDTTLFSEQFGWEPHIKTQREGIETLLLQQRAAESQNQPENDETALAES